MWPSAAIAGESLMAVGFAASLTRALTASANGDAITVWLMGIAAFAALRGLLGWLALRLAASRARQIKTALRRRALGTILNARAGSGRLVGEHAAVVVDDIEALDGYFVRYAPAKSAAASGPLIIFLAAATASPIGAGLLLATLVPFVLLMIVAGGAAAQQSRRQLDALAKLSGLFADRIRALPLILAFQAEAAETAQIGLAAREVSERTLSVLRIAFVSSAGLEFFAALSVALVAVYAGFGLLGLLPFAVPETITFAHGFFVLALAPEFYAPLRRLAAAYHEKQLGDAAAARLQEALATPQAPVADPSVMLPNAPAISFVAACAGFADDPGLVIGPLDLHIPAGSIAALMGPTGAGKTTLLRLLVGEAMLASGEVMADGHRLSKVGSFAGQVAWAGQSPILLPRTIGENIALGWPQATAAEIAAVAEQAGLGAVLLARGRGMDTMLDERGSGLSGGERRRIGLARALLKPARILLLDEPTADLDAASEAAIIEVLITAAKGRTVLIATHSEAVAAIAHQVVRL